MRGKKARKFRKIAVATYPRTEADVGYPAGSATYWGPQWRRFYRYLKRHVAKGGN